MTLDAIQAFYVARYRIQYPTSFCYKIWLHFFTLFNKSVRRPFTYISFLDIPFPKECVGPDLHAINTDPKCCRKLQLASLIWFRVFKKEISYHLLFRLFFQASYEENELSGRPPPIRVRPKKAPMMKSTVRPIRQ
jgi:hypothetical protein